MRREPSEVITGLVEDQELVFQFFAIFSRFEYALKRASFLKKQSRVEPHWDAYANTLRGLFRKADDGPFTAAVKYIKSQPPRKQVVHDGQLGWEDCTQGSGETEERYVLRLVVTVRNNLFHGGKYPYPIGPASDVDRNRQLLNASIIILKHCLILSPQVGAAFEEAA